MSVYDDYLLIHAETYEWKISDHDGTLPSICKYKNGDKYTSEIFQIAKLKWIIELYPNGYREDSEGSFKLYTKLLSLPNKWKNIVVCRTMECVESYSKITNICKYKKEESYGWTSGALLLKEVRDNKYTSLTFKITIKILSINYNHINTMKLSKPTIFNPFLLRYDYRKKYRLNWKLSDKLIKKMKEANYGKKFESKMFNDMWCLQCNPNGRVRDTKSAGEVRVYLQICGLPKGIRSIFVQYTIYFAENKIEDKGTKKFSYDSTWIRTENKLLTFASFKKFSQLNICANIEILNEYDVKGNDITIREKEKSWNEYINDDYIHYNHNNNNNKHHRIKINKTNIKKYDEMDHFRDRLDLNESRINSLSITTEHINKKLNKLLSVKNNNNNEEIIDDERKEYSISDYSQSVKSMSFDDGIRSIRNNDYDDGENINNIKLKLDTMTTKMELMMNQMSQIMNKQNDKINQRNKRLIQKRKIVYKWLVHQVNLKEYYDCFILNGYDDLDTVKYINMDQLKCMGINNESHRKQILQNVKLLKKHNQIQSNSSS